MKKIVIFSLLMMVSLTTFSKTLCRAYFCEKTEYATDEVTSSNCNIIFSINEESRLLEFYGDNYTVIRYGKYYSTNLDNGLPVIVANSEDCFGNSILLLFFSIGETNFIGLKDDNYFMIFKYIKIHDN